MIIIYVFHLVLCFNVLYCVSIQVFDNEIISRLQNAMVTTNSSIQSIYNRWNIENFPNFLNSVYMSSYAWNLLKEKFASKILNAITRNINETFVISFMGSSVTAGHDSYYNQSFPMVVGDLMRSAFQSSAINLEVRNVGIGANPCVPYMLCPLTFSGYDSDMIHWEQTYYCLGSDERFTWVFEQFIRRSLEAYTKPIIIFSESETPNWKTEKCAFIASNVSLQEYKPSESEINLREIWKTDPISIVSSLNKDILSSWPLFHDILRVYDPHVGIQIWKHTHFWKYKCRGPYIVDWHCCSRIYHPSILGHEVRAAHHSLIWLRIFYDAIETTLKQMQDISGSLHQDIPSSNTISDSLFVSNVSAGSRCYTTFKPCANETMSLRSLQVYPSNKSKETFHHDIYENFFNKRALELAREKELKDIKYILYGNKTVEPLSLRAKVVNYGYIHVCMPEGIKMQGLPKEFNKFWETGTQFYLTKNIWSDDNVLINFDFIASNAHYLEYVKTRDKCIRTKYEVEPGYHVLTIAPKSENYIMISFVILP